jgi:hypothetical protein
LKLLRMRAVGSESPDIASWNLRRPRWRTIASGCAPYLGRVARLRRGSASCFELRETDGSKSPGHGVLLRP